MGFFAKLFSFLNGKKTAIGGALMLAGQLIPEVSGIAPKILPALDTLTTQGGAIIVSIGLIHKAIKSVAGKE